MKDGLGHADYKTPNERLICYLSYVYTYTTYVVQICMYVDIALHMIRLPSFGKF